MPPLPTLPGVFQVVFKWHVSAFTAINRIHIMSTAPTAAGIMDILNTNVTAAMWSQATVDARIESVRITELDNESNALETTTTGPQWAGVAASGEYVLAPAVVLTLRTDKRGKQNNGRIYLPFPAESVVGNHQITTPTQTALQAAWDAFKAALPTSGSSLQVTSYGVFNKNPDGTETVGPGKEPRSNAVPSIVVHQPLGTQRMRQSRVYS